MENTITSQNQKNKLRERVLWNRICDEFGNTIGVERNGIEYYQEIDEQLKQIEKQEEAHNFVTLYATSSMKNDEYFALGTIYSLIDTYDNYLSKEDVNLLNQNIDEIKIMNIDEFNSYALDGFKYELSYELTDIEYEKFEELKNNFYEYNKNNFNNMFTEENQHKRAA